MNIGRPKLVDDLSNPLEDVRSGLVGLVEGLTSLRKLVKNPNLMGGEEALSKEARAEFEEHASNLLARLHECRAHAALASQALARVIALQQPPIPKEHLQ